MWLLHTDTLELQEFIKTIPPYAVLSHTWGNEEVSFKDLQENRKSALKKSGFVKIQQCCKQARKDGLQWTWIDSCCIDKRSSGELSEALNSMFRWYERADICFAYLEDVPPHDDVVEMKKRISNSRWFTRGWTLQELIAPRKVQFFANDWSLLGVKSQEDHDFTTLISHITGIDAAPLLYRAILRRVSIAMRMSWASERETTREEDRAYSLMGIFDVNMPIIYGEGLQKAFERLQIEIMKQTPDQSIFAWRHDDNYSDHFKGFGLLATSPSYFKNSRFIIEGLFARIRPFTVTNIGIQITLRMNPAGGSHSFHNSKDNGLWSATLRCLDSPDETGKAKRVQIILRERRQIIRGSGIRIFERVFSHNLNMVDHITTRFGEVIEIHVPNPDQIVHLEQAGFIHSLEETLYEHEDDDVENEYEDANLEEKLKVLETSSFKRSFDT